MNKYLTIEIDREVKRAVKVGHLCAENVSDAYEQMGSRQPKDQDETLIIKEGEVNQLIVDINKMARKM